MNTETSVTAVKRKKGKNKFFTRKRPEVSNDYELAYNTVKDITTAAPIEVAPNNLAAFRKYAYNVAAKQGKSISTRKKSDGIIVYCLIDKNITA